MVTISTTAIIIIIMKMMMMMMMIKNKSAYPNDHPTHLKFESKYY